jgi:rhodanese-related sulfurtransferase
MTLHLDGTGLHMADPTRTASATSWTDIGVREAAVTLSEFTTIDVRHPDEFSGSLGHIPQALLIPLDQLESALEQLDRKSPCLLVCRSGRRSSRAARLLAENGFIAVNNLLGGMEAWAACRLPRCSCDHSPCPGSSE